MKSQSHLSDLASRMESAPVTECRVVTGFDGFVDEMISLVAERRSLNDFTPVPDILTFGHLISAAAGHSSLREIVINDIHPGGCAVNLADGLSSLGVEVDCFATLGDPMHSAFREIASKCHGFHAWACEPGRTMAFEFSDGKLMFSAVGHLAGFTAGAVEALLLEGTYAEACQRAQLIALTDWSLYPHMTDVWRLLNQKVFSKLTHRPHFLIDLVDPSSRHASDILEMAGMLRDFEAFGPVTLGLNGNEANILCKLHELSAVPPTATPEETVAQAAALRNLLQVSRVVIHRIPFAVAAGSQEECIQLGPFCPNPKKSTGAGDRFNAGLCLGISLGMSAADSLALGCGTSGFFVRNARSADRFELVNFLRQWEAGFSEKRCMT